MKTKKFSSMVSALALMASLFMPFATVMPRASAAADTCTWTGGGSDGNFSTAANWTGCDNGTVPEDGDTLVFPMTVAAADRNPTNDMTAGTSFAGIQFTGTNADCSSPSYALSGNEITLTGDVTYDATGSCPVQISLDITLGANVDFINSSTGGTANIFVLGPPDGSGTLSTGAYNAGFTASGSNIGIYVNYDVTGSGNVVMTGPGFVELFDEGFETYAGGYSLNSGYFSFSAKTFGTSAGTVDVSDDASLEICSNSAPSLTIPDNFVLGGPGYGVFEKMIFTKFCGLGAGGDDAAEDPEVTLSGSITLLGNVTFDGYLNDAKLTGALSGTGRTISVSKGGDFTLTVAASSNTSATPNGTYKSEVLETKYSGNQPSTNPYVAYNNEVVIEEGATVGSVTVEGGTLKGVGTVGDLNMTSGKVAPGLSPGCLNSGNLAYTGGSLEIEIAGTTACTEYDRQTVTGTVSLGSATTLDVSFLNNFTPAVNNAFTIIDNDGSDAVAGTFENLADGAEFTVNGVTFQINYDAGDGNDVVLLVTAVGTPEAPDTGVASLLTSPLLTLSAAASVFLLLLGYRVLETKKNR